MARLAAQARAYYYPTPAGEVAAILDIVEPPAPNKWRSLQVLDPCAGRGELLVPFVQRIGADDVDVRAVELDHARWTELQETADLFRYKHAVLCGDAWRVPVPRSSIGLLLMNPPYDRGLEIEWWRRWWPSVVVGGVAVLVIPYYSLPSITDDLAENFDDVRVVRFSDAEFPVFKQVVVVAKRRAPGAINPATLELLARDVESLPVLGTDVVPPVAIGDLGTHAGREWAVGEIDVALAESAAAPWTGERRRRVVPIPGSLGCFATAAAVVEAVEAPVVTTLIPPTAAHVSNMLAAGVLDGAVVGPDDPSIGLPAIAIRGTYSRDWVESDRRHNRDGEIVAVVEQQVPVLTISAIDLVTGDVYDLVQDAEPVFDAERYATLLADPDLWAAAPEYKKVPLVSPLQLFSAGDLLVFYARAVRDAMAARCRVVFDPAVDDEPIDGIDSFPRRPFRAQRERIAALLRWVRTGRNARIPGQTGTGKTTVAAITAAAYCLGRKKPGISRVYIHAPSHLVHEWVVNQIPTILGPAVEVVELDSIADVDHWMRDDRRFDGEPIDGVRVSFGVVSRSRAKLGSLIDGIDGVARPAAVETRGDSRVITKYRAACPGCGADLPADQTRDDRGKRRARCDAPLPRVPMDDATKAVDPFLRAWERNAADLSAVGEIAVAIAEYVARTGDAQDGLIRGMTLAMHSLPADVKDDVLSRVLDTGIDVAEVRDAVLQVALAWDDNAATAARIVITEAGHQPASISRPWLGRIHGTEPGSSDALRLAVDELRGVAKYRTGVCGERLWTATDGGNRGYRRYPLARYIYRRYRRRIDIAISDEAHEAGNPDSAQSQADQLLYQLGCPFIQMTGTSSNGYPRSLHVGLYYGGGRYRDDFGAGDADLFQRVHGYNRRIVEDVDLDGRVVARGRTSAARTRIRPQGTPAPGITPAAVVRYVLESATPLRLDDLDLDLPAHSERTILVTPDPYQLSEQRRLARACREALTRDSFTERSGALRGALAQVGSILDRNIDAVGNNPGGGYEIRYPEAFGSELVAASSGTPGDVLLPKEAALVEYCLKRRRAGGRVIVSVWFTSPGCDDSVSTRIVRILSDAGLVVAHLEPGRVPTKKRITWIDRHVIARGADVLVVQPRAVETGINNLVYFDAIAVFDGIPSPNTYDQLMGRIHRPGKTRPTEMVSFVYDGTVQVAIHEHQMRKVAVARATDGVDPREALRSVGADGGSVGYGMGLAELILRSV